MHFTIFYSDFKSNEQQEAFPNVDVYQVACKVLGINPNPHNGTWLNVMGMFANSSANKAAVFNLACTIVLVLSFVSLDNFI